MPADFSAAAKAAKASIPVPPLNLETILRRSHAERASERLRRIGVSVAVALGIAGSAVALAASLNQGIHVWIFGSTVKASIQSFAQVRAPMAADVERIVKSADFPVVMPAGVPKDYRVMWIAYSPAEHPAFISVNYQASSGAGMGVTVMQTSGVEHNRALLQQSASARTTTNALHFEIGGETVLVQGRHVTPAQASGVERAMRSATAAQALAELETHVTRLVVLAPVMTAPLELAAERTAPLSGKNFLLARWGLHELQARAAHNQPLRDPRAIQVTNIPSVHGAPDYRNATVRFARPIAIAAGGVRTIAQALRRAKIAPNCNCAILAHQSSGTYALWKIDAAPPYRAEKLTGR